MTLNAAAYVPGETRVHRADPRAKVVLLFVYSLALFWVDTWAGMAFFAAAAGAVWAGARIPVGQAVRQTVPVQILVAFTIAANALAPAGFTLAGLDRGCFFGARIVLLVAVSFCLTATTSSLALAQALEDLMAPLARLRVPVRDIAAVVSVALRFIPQILDEYYASRDALATRGARFAGGGARAAVRAWQALFMGLFIRVFKRADTLATALESRCYGAVLVPTRLHPLPAAPRQWAAAAAGAAALVACAVLM